MLFQSLDTILSVRNFIYHLTGKIVYQQNLNKKLDTMSQIIDSTRSQKLSLKAKSGYAVSKGSKPVRKAKKPNSEKKVMSTN